MGTYTNYFEKKAYNIFKDEDFVLELKNTIGEFRSFAEALDYFIGQHGYEGDLKDVERKVRFVSDKCTQAGVPVPRNLKKWYTEGKRIDRNSKVPFQVCFAFQLDVEKVNDFLHRICLARGIDCHLAEECVYYYAFKNRLTYLETVDILKRLNPVRPKKIDVTDLVYTELIEEEIDGIETVDELVDYLNENESKFAYNNATACETIQILWDEIMGSKMEKGIARREREQGHILFEKDEAAQKIYETKTGRKERKRDRDSVWETYLQILGMSGNYVADCYKNRSLKSILKDNSLVHPLVENAFPDRDGLNKILHGEHVSYERIRKLLILLTFYKFYAGRMIRQDVYEEVYEENPDDGNRCISYINNNLTASNYMSLYPGNPYDFLILMAIRSEEPLAMFREYMHELYFSKINIDALYQETEK